MSDPDDTVLLSVLGVHGGGGVLPCSRGALLDALTVDGPARQYLLDWLATVPPRIEHPPVFGPVFTGLRNEPGIEVYQEKLGAADAGRETYPRTADGFRKVTAETFLRPKDDR